MTNEELNKLYEEIERQRLKIADCLFNSHRQQHQLSNARKLVVMASELAELCAIVEHNV